MRKAHKAALNLVSALLDQGTVVLTSFLLTPHILQHLGSAQLGFWLFVQKTIAQIGMLDGRCGEVLKWKIARQNEREDHEEKRKEIGASLISSAVFLPQVGLATIILLVQAPMLPAASGVATSNAKLTILILSLNIIIGIVFTHLDAILRGMNQGFRRMGTRGAVTVLGGVFSYILLNRGYGLPALSAVAVCTSLVGTLALFAVVRSNMPWALPIIPDIRRVRSYIRQSAGFTISAFINLGFLSLDHLLVGLLLNAVSVTHYSITKFLPNLIPIVAANVYAAIIPSIAGKIGSHEYSVIARLHIETTSLSTLVAMSLLAPVVAVNEFIVSRWVGASHYAGTAVSLLAILATLQQLSIQQEATLLNSMLAIRERIRAGGWALGVLMLLAFLLAPRLELLGIGIAVVISRAILLFQLQRIVATKVPDDRFSPGLRWRSQVYPVVILAGWEILRRMLPPAVGVIDAVCLGLLFLVLGATLGWWILLTSQQRRVFATRVKSLRPHG